MANVLLRCANNFEQFLKVAVRNRYKKMINLVMQRSNKTFVYSVRNMSLTAEMQGDINQFNTVGGQFNIVHQHFITYNFISKKQIQRIMNLINSSDCISKYEIHFLFYWCNTVTDCLPFERVQLGQSLWRILNICNYDISVTHYNALLKIYIENEQDFYPMEFMKDMESKGIYPDNDTYEACINHYCRKGNVTEILRLVGNMRNSHLFVTETICNLIMMGFSKSGNITEINKVLDNMKKRRMKLSSQTYTAVLCGYAQFNDMQQIVDVIETCKSNNIHFTNKEILDVIYMLAVNRHTKCIHTMYKYLRETKEISNTEIQIMLKLISIGEVSIADHVLVRMCINKVWQFQKIMKIIFNHLIHSKKMVQEVTNVCAVSANEKLFDKFLLISLYYSLENDDSHISLPLLRICRHHHIIKPHFFWPLLMRAAMKYDIQGILDILKIMITDFDVYPCADTLADYVLPFTYGNISQARNLLMEQKLSETVIDNAYVLSMLRKGKLRQAAVYIRTFEGKYFYKIIAHDLRYASIFKDDANHFVSISRNLIENLDYYGIPRPNEKPGRSVPVGMDKQLRDFIIEFPSHKMWLRKVMRLLQSENINLKDKTINTVTNFLNNDASTNVTDVVELMSNKAI